MTKRKQTTTNASPDAGRPPGEQALLKALAEPPAATVAELAAAIGVGRSTASKLLARLESTGEARRTPGGRDGRLRLPDRWALTSTATTPPAGKGTKTSAGEKPQQQDDGAAGVDRLRPGQLDGLVSYRASTARCAHRRCDLRSTRTRRIPWSRSPPSASKN